MQISDLPAGALDTFVVESEQEGCRFLRRLKDGWLSAANRFSQPGEALFGVFAEDRLLGVGGINQESAGCGRLRRFYVKRDARRKGIGRSLARHILAFAAQHYSRVVLRTNTETADRFYRSLGFDRVKPDGDITHIIAFAPQISLPELSLHL